MANLNLFQLLFAVPDNMETEREYREFAVLTSAGLFGFIGHLVILSSFLFFDVISMAYINIGSCLIFLLIFLGRKSRKYASHLLVLGIIEILLHAVVAVVFIGDQAFITTSFWLL